MDIVIGENFIHTRVYLSIVWPSINMAFYSNRIIDPKSFEMVRNDLSKLSLDDILMKVCTVHDSNIILFTIES